MPVLLAVAPPYGESFYFTHSLKLLFDTPAELEVFYFTIKNAPPGASSYRISRGILYLGGGKDPSSFAIYGLISKSRHFIFKST